VTTSKSYTNPPVFANKGKEIFLRLDVPGFERML
jgi:hypothetical protein